MVPDSVDLQAYIQAHIAEIGNAEDVARRLNLPYENLRKTFRRCTGMTLGRYIEQMRIDKAKRLLEETDLLCFEVAFQVGYEREDVAMRAFKRATGTCMQTYRMWSRSCRNGDEAGEGKQIGQNCKPELLELSS